MSNETAHTFGPPMDPVPTAMNDGSPARYQYAAAASHYGTSLEIIAGTLGLPKTATTSEIQDAVIDLKCEVARLRRVVGGGS